MKYQIKGGNLPVVICDLEENETVITERGSMSWMSPNIKMETGSNGGIGKMLGRMFSGEALFQNRYTAQGGIGIIAFASSFPGTIIPFEINNSSEIICQKTGFLAGTAQIDVSIFFQKKFGSGFFGGEGFIMQRISGNGTVFIEIDGAVVDYELAADQSMIVDTGYLAAMTGSCQIDIQQIKGVKNVLFGGEGLFNTRITGPGHIWLQTMPLNNVAAVLRPYFPTGNN